MQKQSKHFFKLIYSHPCWEKQIKRDLKKLVNRQLEPMQIIKQLKQFNYYSYTHKQRQYRKKQNNGPNFKMLFHLYQKDLKDIVANTATVVLDFQEKNPQIPILFRQTEISHDFKKSEVLLLICLMFLSLITNQDCKFSGKFCYHSNFSYILSQQKYKTQTLIQYLRIELTQYKLKSTMMIDESQKVNKNPQQILTIYRKVQNRQLPQIIKNNAHKFMKKVTVANDNDSIQNYYGDIKADFANKFIGGGSLTAGCVQEEIMFANHPQLYISMLFSEMMGCNQSLFFVGFKKYFKNNGYAGTTSFAGHQQVSYDYDDKNRAKQYIAAIDAIHFPFRNDMTQFSREYIDRELFKAYVGFNAQEGKRVVTGNWGCGAFNGNIPLKFMIQWIACCLAQKQMIYTPFGFQDKLNKYKQAYQALQKYTVSDVYNLLIKQSETIQNCNQNIIQRICKRI